MNTRKRLSNWMASLLQQRPCRVRSNRKGPVHTFSQALESRALLSAVDCLGRIEGVTFNDINNNGISDTGEELSNAVDGVVVHLFDAGANLTFDSLGNGGTALSDDTLIGTALPDANGSYQFDGLAAGTYFVEQPTPAGYIQRVGGSVSGAIVISPADALGIPGLTIDTFDDPLTPQVATANSGSPTGFRSELVGAVGGERDLLATHVSGGLNVELSANAVANTLALSSGTGTTGSGVVSWDGVDGASTLDATGLGGIDLTNGGASSGFMIRRGGDAVGSLSIVVHTDGATSSSATTTIPTTTASVFVPFSSFTSSGLPADFTSVGAVEMGLSGPAGFDGEVDLFQTFGPTSFSANFQNFEPLTLGGTVFDDTDNSGDLSGLESGIDGVNVTLFEDTNGSGLFEAAFDLIVADAPNTDATTGGNYSFSNLFPGDYIVRVDSGNFSAALSNMVSSTGNDPVPDPDDNLDNDDNGVASGASVVSRAITLEGRREPTTDGDSDNNTNLAVDFGFLELVDIQVSKSDSGDPVTAGGAIGNLVYTISASNIGPSAATGVQITDAFVASLPAGWVLDSGVGSGTTTFASGTGIWSIGDLDSGVTETLILTFTIGSAAASGDVTNTAVVSAVDQTESSTANNTSSEVTSIVRLVDIGLQKNDNVDPVTAGSGTGNLIYTVSATNNGPSDATGVEVTDAFATALPAGWSLESGVGSAGGGFSAATGVWSIGDLAAGQTKTLQLTLTVGREAATGTVTNTAAVTGVIEPESTTANNSASEDTTVARLVDIQVFKSDNEDPVIAGSSTGNLVYTVTATNNGPSNASGVEVTDAFMTSLPLGWSLGSGVGSGLTSFSPVTGVWLIGDLAAGTSESLTLTITVAKNAVEGTFTNTAVVSAVTEPESTTANNSTSEDTTVERRVDIEIVKADNADPVTAGSGPENLIYTVNVSNNGPSNATGVQVTDAFVASLPTGWSLVSGIGDNSTSFDPTTGIWTVGDLPDGASRMLELTFTVGGEAASETVTNTAVVTAVNETETTVANNLAREDTTIARVVDIALEKIDNVDPIIAGSGTGNLVYTLTATNNGPSAASGVEVTDSFVTSLPSGWILESGVGSDGSTFDTGFGIWNVGSLETGSSRTLTLTISVGSSAEEGTVTNTASVTGVDQVETTTTNNVASETTTVQRVVDIEVVKSDSVDPVIAGSGSGNLIYTVVATNNGPSDATAVVVVDAFVTTLPAGWTLVSGIASGAGTFAATTGLWTIGDLASGASESLLLTMTVDDTAANGTFTNTARVSAVAETELLLANNTTSEETQVTRIVDIEILKSDNVDPVIAGSGPNNLSYIVTATNNGPSDASGLQVSDPLLASLPVGWTIESVTESGSTAFSATTGIWNIGSLQGGDSETLSVTLTVGPDAVGGTFTNTATVSALNETDSDAGNDTASEDTTVSRLVDVQVVKTDTGDPVTAGSGPGNLTYTVVATNNGPSDASGLTITDALIASLPTGWSLDSGAGTGSTVFAQGTGSWTIGSLPAGSSETLTLTLTVGNSASAGTTTNTVSVATLNETDTVSANNTDSEMTVIDRSVDLVITKTDSVDPVPSGSGPGNLRYLLSITNNGPSDASGVVAADALMTALPSGWSLDSSSTSGSTTFFPSTGTWNVGNLGAGAVETLELTLTIVDTAAIGITTNTAEIISVNEPDSNPANNVASEDTSVVRAVDVGITKTDSGDPVTAGSGTGNLVYTIQATNNGPGNATGIQVTDALLAVLPAGITLESAVGTGGSTFDTGTGVWDIGNLDVGAVRSLSVTLTVGSQAASGTLTNTAVLSAIDQADATPANNMATEESAIVRQADLALTKSDSGNPVVAGSGTGNLVYMLTIENDGPSDASGVQVSDALIASLPAGFTLESATGSGGSTFDSSTGVWDVGVLARGESRTLGLTLTVSESASVATVHNIAAITRTNEVDPNPSNDTDTESTDIVRVVDIAVTKSDSADPVIAGSGPGNLIYTIRATNNGPADATGVEISDPLLTSLPPGISIDSVTATGAAFNSGTGTWTIGELASGDSRQLTVVLTVSSSVVVSSLTNVARVTAVDQTDGNSANDVASEFTAIQKNVDLVVTKAADVDSVRSPGNIRYTIAVSNNGPSTATNVVLTDALSSQVTFLSSSASQGSVAENAGVLTADLGQLAPGASATVVVDVAVDIPLGGTVSNVATATALENETNPTDNSAAESTVIQPRLFAISGSVYQDLNDNGVQDPGEAPVPGAQVGVFGRDDSGNDILQTTTTNAAGSYQFTGLLQGTYNLFEVQPAIYEDGVETIGSGAGNVTATNDAFFSLNLSASNGGNAVGFNFGEGAIDESKREFLASGQTVEPPAPVDPAESGSLAGRVVVDSNLNGRFDAGDLPVFGASVTLAGRRTNGEAVVVTARTDADGQYLFTGLPSGTYNLVEQQPFGFSDGPEQSGNIMAGAILDDVFAEIMLPSGGNGSGFNFLEFPENAVVPGALAPVLAANARETTSTPILSWSPVTGAVAYDVWLSQISGTSGAVYRNSNFIGTTLTPPTPLALATHKLWVRAVDAQGLTGPWSLASVFDVSPPAQVVSPDRSTVDPTPTIRWTAVDGAELYDIVVYDSAGRDVLRQDDTTDTEFNVTTELTAGRHTVWVRARNSAVTGEWSQGFDFVVTGAPAILGPVNSSILSPPLLEWTDTGAAAYRVWVNDISAGSTNVLDATVQQTSLLMSSGLVDGHEYRFWVQSLDETSASSWSAPQSFTRETSTEVLSPTGDASTDQPTISWRAFPGATHYDLWVSDRAGVFLRDQNVSGTSFTFDTAIPDGDYQVWVQPEGVGQSARWSASNGFTVGALAQPLLATSADSTTDRTPTFTWSQDSKAVATEIWVNHIGVTNRVIHDRNVVGSSFTPTFNLAPGSYVIWVRSRSAAGLLSEWSTAKRLEII